MLRIIAFVILASLPCAVRAQNLLDRTFGTDGIARLRVSYDQPVETSAFEVVVGADGRATTFGSALARFNADGRLDPRFGTEGVLFESVTGIAEPVLGGGFVAVGSRVIRTYQGPFDSCGPDSLDTDVLVVRLREDGRRDPTFGNAGERLVDVPRPLAMVDAGQTFDRADASCTRGGAAYTDDQAYAVVASGDGRITFAGRSSTARGGSRGVLGRLLSDGSLDPSFGVGGRVLLPDSFPRALQGLVQLPDGRYLAAGAMAEGFGVVRLLADGRRDRSFGWGGLAYVPVPGAGWNGVRLVGLTAGPDGTLTAAGNAYDAEVFVRVRADGTLDVSFGQAGAVRVAVANPALRGFAVDGVGRVAGVGDAGKLSRLTLLDEHGSLVRRAGVNLTPGDDYERLEAVRLRADGQFVAAGVASYDTPDGTSTDGFLAILSADLLPVSVTQLTRTRSALALLTPAALGVLPDGAPLVSFLQNRQRYVASFSPTGGLGTVRASGGHENYPVHIEPVGPDRAVLMTAATSEAGRVFVLGADGPLHPGGPFRLESVGAETVTRDAAGRIYATGFVRAGPGDNSTDIGVVRLTQSGAVDEGFGGGLVRHDLRALGTSPNGLMNDYGRAIAVDAEGRIYVAGMIGGDDGVVRLNSFGVLDVTFGQSGVWRPRPGVRGLGRVALVPRPGGGVRIVALTSVEGRPEVGLVSVALDAAGTEDPTLGEAGYLFFPRPSIDPDALLVRADGSVAVSGTGTQGTGLFLVAPDGRPDTSFGPGGVRFFDGEAGRIGRTLLAKGPGGSIYVSGLRYDGEASAKEILVVRVRPQAWATPTDDSEAPSGLVLDAPFPNPARDFITVRFTLGVPGPARLAAYDALGREVAVLHDGPLPAGAHEATLGPSGLAPGVYTVRLTAAGQSRGRTVSVLR